MPDYSKAKIYRVFCGNDEYIGSTIRPLSERMSAHRTTFKNDNACSSKCIFEKHGIENVKIELIEEYPCENREQLLKREGEIQRERECVNHNIAGRTYDPEYKEYKNSYDRAYSIANAEKIRRNRKWLQSTNYYYYQSIKRENKEKKQKQKNNPILEIDDN